MKPVFFKDPAALRNWFEKNHKSESELHVGYYKVATGKPSVTWSESVDEALCVGWIDGIRRSIDEESYTIRFTPRKPGSIWSAVNIAKIEQLTKEGRMKPEGRSVYDTRKDTNSKGYSYETQIKDLTAAYEKQFKANKKAWEYFISIAPGYRRLAIHRVMEAKQEKTRLSRLQKLVADCEANKKFWMLNP